MPTEPLAPGHEAIEPRRSAGPAADARRVPEWVERTTFWLDEAIRIPGTRLSIGLDSILGFLVPGVGDAAAAVASAAAIWIAIKNRVPRVVVARMVLNVLVDAVLGAIPIVGDVFDVAFKANRRNLDLLRKYSGQGMARNTAGDYAVLAAAVLAIGIAIALPIALVLWIASSFG